MSGLYVQYGCGWSAPDSWLNFDSSPTLRFERLPVVGRLYTRNARRFPGNVHVGDIVRGLPLADASCSGIYASHVIEHLALEDARVALRNTHRYLASGGLFRLLVPDLEALARAYLADGNEDAAMRFMESAGLGEVRRSHGPIGILAAWLGGSAHRWMWDEKSLARELRESGFTGIRRAQFGDSEDPRFSEVEDRGRFAGALALQCRK